jgi:chitin synthase
MSDPEIGRSTSLRRNLSKSSKAADGNKPRRQKSLVRPERERNDPNNRLYHYRQRVTNTTEDETNLAPSTTGNQPVRQLERRPTKREVLLRRGRSILGREEKQDDELLGNSIDYNSDKKRSCTDFNPWLTYCHILTCCIPSPFLRCVGMIC